MRHVDGTPFVPIRKFVIGRNVCWNSARSDRWGVLLYEIVVLFFDTYMVGASLANDRFAVVNLNASWREEESVPPKLALFSS